jgi:hypothetical protein
METGPWNNDEEKQQTHALYNEALQIMRDHAAEARQ